MPLNIMVLESERGAADDAARELTEAGHTVLRCHEPGAAAFPCNGLHDQASCPLQSHSVDVALAVRSRPRSQPAPQEDGIRCALMHHVPLVVAGPTVLDPYEEYEMRIVERGGDVVGVCEEVAVSALPQHTRIATDALRSSRNPDQTLAAAAVVVTRRHGSLLASVSGLDALAPRQRDAAIVRMTAKLREFDPVARGLDVVVERPV